MKWMFGQFAFLSAACVALFLIGCSTHRGTATATPSQLVGTYHVTYEPYAGTVLGNETLILRPDSTFKQIFMPTKGKPRKNAGKWKLEYFKGVQVVSMYDHVSYLSPSNDSVAVSPTGMNNFADFSVQGKRVNIVIDDDLGMYYEKKS